MKKRFILTLMILTIICGMSIFSINSIAKEEPTITLPTLNATRPFFGYGDENTTVLRAREDSQFQGAIVEANANENVTIWYGYSGGTNTSAPFLFGDDGTDTNDSLSWDEGKLLTYDNETTVETGGGIYAYYNYSFTMVSEFIVVYGRYGEFEDDIGVSNLITSGVWIESAFRQEVYTQFDSIDMDITVHDYNLTSYGLMYREVLPDHSGDFQNVTVIQDRVGDYANLTTSFSHSYAPDTLVEIRAFIEHYDNMTNEFRYMYENQAHIVTIVDGSPEVDVTSSRYTNSLNVSLYWSASAIKENITSVEIDWDDLSGIDTIINMSTFTTYHLYSSFGEYNISLTVNASEAYVDAYVMILIEQEDPSGTIFIKDTDGSLLDPDLLNVTSIETNMKQMTFVVESSDTGGSGVEKMVVLTDEGNSVAVFNENEVTIQFREYGVHQIYFKVYDNAGNFYEKSFFVELVKPEDPSGSPIPFPFGIVSIIGLIAIALLFKKKRN